MVVDLIGYRRHGHSEVDDPTITQPLLYKAIKDHPPLWEIYAEESAQIDAAKSRADAIRRNLEAAQKKAGHIRKKPMLRELPSYWDTYKGGRYKPAVRSGDWLVRRGVGGADRAAYHLSRGFPHPSQGQEAAGAARRDGHRASVRWITEWRRRWRLPVW